MPASSFPYSSALAERLGIYLILTLIQLSEESAGVVNGMLAPNEEMRDRQQGIRAAEHAHCSNWARIAGTITLPLVLATATVGLATAQGIEVASRADGANGAILQGYQPSVWSPLSRRPLSGMSCNYMDYGEGTQVQEKKGTAGQQLLTAARIRNEAEANKQSWPIKADFARADDLEDRAGIPSPDQAGMGGELATVLAGDLSAHFRNTVDDPSYVTAGASHDRLELAHEANVLEMALDAAETAQASNSLEKMLAHQLAATHKSAMKLDAQLNHQIGRMDGVISDNALAARNVEVARLANSTARVMAAFQQGLLTMQRLKSGGRQVVTVQHVTVADGGQAVVAGQVTSRRKRGGGRKAKGGGSENGQ